jgi:hypothetical protein
MSRDRMRRVAWKYTLLRSEVVLNLTGSHTTAGETRQSHSRRLLLLGGNKSFRAKG